MKKRIPFNVKYRPQIESGKYKVETERGVPVRIICWDLKNDTYPIVACLEVDGKECPPRTLTKEGHFSVCKNTLGCDLWCVVDSVEITEDYVPFYTAKLLKEKGFNAFTYSYYSKDDEESEPELCMENLCSDNWNGTPDEVNDLWFSAPTLSMAMKWLREVHGLYVEITLVRYLTSGMCFYRIVVSDLTNKGLEKETGLDRIEYNTYEDAAEAAIKYCLENLI